MKEDSNSKILEESRFFWNSNPCDGQKDVFQRMKFRYEKEPWLPPVLDEISQHGNIIEIGCGQGTDALYCCRQMNSGDSYTGIDYSNASIQNANKSADEFSEHLKIHPTFAVGNAEQLDFGDQSFECVASIGVLHHTPDTEKSIDEVYRVLQVNGIAFIALYRLFSPKIIAAYFLRFFSYLVDKITFRKNLLYGLFKRLGSNHALGTMIHECLGVPILHSYTRGQMKRLFRRFEIERLIPIGTGFPFLGKYNNFAKGYSPIGTFWLIVVRKKQVF